MNAEPKISTWEDAVVWLRNQPDRRQLVLDAFYDDPLIAAAERYFDSDEWQAVSKLLRGPHRQGARRRRRARNCQLRAGAERICGHRARA